MRRTGRPSALAIECDALFGKGVSSATFYLDQAKPADRVAARMAIGSENPRGSFPSTHWSLVLRACGGDAKGSAEALEALCRAYWFPLYAFARRGGCDPDLAQDLTQDFFCRLLEKGFLASADPIRGRFRSFLLASFKHLMANHRRDASRLKRGGGAVVFSLDTLQPEEHYRLEPQHSLTPELIFERQWAEAVLGRTLEKLAAESSNRAIPFENLKPFLVGPKGSSPFKESAEQLGVSGGALKLVVYRMRQRYAELFRDEIAQTVSDPNEIDDEIRHVFRILSRD